MYRKGTPGHRLSALRACDTSTWRDEIRGAIIAAHGNVAEAARSLEIGLRTLFRWLAEDERLRAYAVVSRDEQQRTASGELRPLVGPRAAGAR